MQDDKNTGSPGPSPGAPSKPCAPEADVERSAESQSARRGAMSEHRRDPPELQFNEAQVNDLLESDLWNTDTEERFDRFTRLAARVFDMRRTSIVLFDHDRASFKSGFGFRLSAAAQEIDLCRQACAQRDVFVVENVPEARRAGANADDGVTLRFFAGRALRGEDGAVVGCLAVLDCRPRAFEADARQTLTELARLVEEEFSLNAALKATRTSINQLLDRDPALPAATHAIVYQQIGRLVEHAGETDATLGIFYLSVDNLYDMAVAHGPGRIQAMVNGWMDDLKNANDDLTYIARVSERGFVGAFACEGSPRAALERCERLRAHAQREVDHEGVRFAFEASAGLCVYPDHGDSGMALIGRAQLAHDNQSWSSETSLFNAGIAKRFRRHAMLRSRFEAAVRDGAVTFHAQPLIANAQRRLIGFELLARWHDAELGDISPAEFVPIIDPESGPRRALVAHALETACRLIAAWQQRFDEVPYIAINVPGAELYQPDFHELVTDRLTHHGVDARHLIFELTERSVIRDFDATARALRRLTAIGARIAIDDFGSGYSSIAYLTKLPISIVKLDKTVVQQIVHSRSARELAEGIVALAQGQRLSLVAEGVETRGQQDQVVGMGCEYTQGFLLGRPQPTDTLDVLLDDPHAGCPDEPVADPDAG